MDKLSNKLFGIECNFGELNGIDFKKGCYVGQENTSRIKLKIKDNFYQLRLFQHLNLYQKWSHLHLYFPQLFL